MTKCWLQFAPQTWGAGGQIDHNWSATDVFQLATLVRDMQIWREFSALITNSFYYLSANQAKVAMANNKVNDYAEVKKSKKH